MVQMPTTFGSVILEGRKKLGLSQKELASRIHKEDGEPITPQYLNDIEHDRRSPSSDHLVDRFSRVLGIGSEYLLKLAGRLPEDVRTLPVDEQTYRRAMVAFRRVLKKR